MRFKYVTGMPLILRRRDLGPQAAGQRAACLRRIQYLNTSDSRYTFRPYMSASANGWPC